MIESARPRLLFIFIQPSSFVREDLAIVQEEYEVRRFQFGVARKPGFFPFAGLLMKQFAWLCRELPRSSAVYGWFADYHMALPVLLGKLARRPVVVAVGGFDAIRLPTLDYGVWLSRWRRPLARFVMKRADLLLPVSSSLVHSTNRFSEWPRSTEQGIRVFVPEIITPIRVLPTGYDPERWPMGPVDRPRVVGTVGLVDSDRTLRRKGIDLFIEVARRLPDVRFRVIGIPDPGAVRTRYRPPENVELLPPVPRDELVAHYHETSVYLQLSRAEGLPNVLCEAMLCGCVPVGSAVFGIPEGVGDAGFVVDTPEPAAIAEVVRTALEEAPVRRSAARDHIVHDFHLDLRRRTLRVLLRNARP